jgi:hypothetical protein
MSQSPQTFGKSFQFPIKLGKIGGTQFPGLIACGGEGSWVTNIACPENVLKILNAIEKFQLSISPLIIWPWSSLQLDFCLYDYKDCRASFENVILQQQGGPRETGLRANIYLTGPDYTVVGAYKKSIEQHIQFFVGGSYEIDWHPEGHPLVESFELIEFGYRNILDDSMRTVFRV